MPNTGEYYDHKTYPQTGASGSSAAMRAELDTIEAAFNKLASFTGGANKLIKINAAATGQEASAVFSDDGTDGTIAGDLYVSGGQIGQSSAQKHTIPAVANDTFALLAATQTLTNKTVNLSSNTLSGTLAQFNAALSDDNFASLTGSETLTNKTLTSPVINGGSISGITDLAVADGGTGASSASAARTSLGVVPGTDVLAYDANLQGFVNTFTLPTLDASANTVLATNGLGTLSFVAQQVVPDGDKGDITVSGGGTVWLVDPLAITTGKLANGSVTNEKLAFDGSLSSLSNLILNGNGVVNQENITSTATSNTYLVDMWKQLFAGTSVGVTFGISSSGSVSNVGPTHFYIQTNTTKATLAAGDYAFFNTFIEGFYFSKLKYGTPSAKTATLSFRASVTGVASATVSIAVQNFDSSRSYVTSVNLTNAVQNYSITIPGDTAGTWAVDGSLGATISVTHAAGSTFQTATPNAWVAGNFLATTSQSNLLATLNATINIGDFNLLPGTTRAPFEPRPYQEELALCQRYFEELPIVNSVGYAQTSTASFFGQDYKVIKRASPSVSFSGTATIIYGAGSTTTTSTFTADSSSTGRLGFSATTAAVLTAGNALRIQQGVTAKISARF